MHKSITYQNLSPVHTGFLTAISSTQDPTNFKDAQSQSVWQKAMAEELAALEENKTWSITPLPLGKHAVGSRWIYKTKFKSDRSIDRHKARLVAQDLLRNSALITKRHLLLLRK